MLHTPDSPEARAYQESIYDAIKQSASTRDRMIASVENLTELGTAAGCDADRMRQAAGTL